MPASFDTQTPQWSSRWAFILAAIGSSVGLGNLWRFSAEAGSNGGGAFILIYLLCVVFIGIPTMMSEFMVGRAGQAGSSLNSARDLANRSGVSRLWASGVWVGLASGFLIVSFYSVIAAWVMSYIPKFLTGAFNGQTPVEIAGQFSQMTSNPTEVVGWFVLFCGLVIWLVSRGVNRGLELTSKILMPAFFLLLICLSIFSMMAASDSGGTGKALSFMFSPDFSKLSGEVAVSALGQAFFSIGLGMAIMVTYGSYLPRAVSIPRSACIVALADTFVALVAGMAIFPIVFQYDLDFTAGAGLFFQTLPTALVATPGGNLVGAAFFCMAFFAALTTAVSLLEPTTGHISEQFNIPKPKAAIMCGVAMVVLGAGSLLSMQFLDFLDGGLTGPIMLPLSALIIVLFVGWRLDKTILDDQLDAKDKALGGILFWLVRYLAPVMITIIMVSGIYDKYFSG
ncbi:MAG: sodium-dependent transporter [Gammaproteobacteria bacterium]